VIKTVECLIFHPMSSRAQHMLTSLIRAGPSEGLAVQVVETGIYEGKSDLLLLWGPGAPNRFEPMQAQRHVGRHVLALDLAYWQRDTKNRLSIDAAHPQDWVMRRPLPPERFVADKVRVAEAWKPNGPVIIAGLGQKARVQYGADVIDAWERQIMTHARADNRVVLYRRKDGTGTVPRDCAETRNLPIERVLTGASLVATWHSNVAVDAIRLGIPVVCRDGAAAAVCSDHYCPELRPLPTAIRHQFLTNLAWFQWAPHEAQRCWQFVQECLA
jgi:hypothetical protein